MGIAVNVNNKDWVDIFYDQLYILTFLLFSEREMKIKVKLNNFGNIWLFFWE